MAPKGGSKQQSEEDLLLQDFSRNLSAKSSALFFGNAFIVSAIPIWLYWRIWHMDLIQSAVLYSVMTLVSTYLVAFAYKNVKFVLKHKVAQKREDAVSKEVTRKLSEADNRKMSRKEKDESALPRDAASVSSRCLLYSLHSGVFPLSHGRRECPLLLHGMVPASSSDGSSDPD
ncbi:Translocon-associated protein subunit gamma [Lemmus lemmus]